MALSLDARIEVALGHKDINGAFVQEKDLGVWDKFSGGSIDSEDNKYRAGGRAKEESLGGTTTTENITVSRLFRIERDFALLSDLYAGVGIKAVQVTRHYLDPSSTPIGSPSVGYAQYIGKLKAVKEPEHDSNSSDVALIELEFAVEKPTATAIP